MNKACGSIPQKGGDKSKNHMQLLTKELREKLPALYATENEKDPTVWVKYFCPWNNWKWYATEGSPVDEDGYYDTAKEKVDFLFFGYVTGHDNELGYFSLSEMESIKGPWGLKIERDLWFTPCKLSEVKSGKVS